MDCLAARDSNKAKTTYLGGTQLNNTNSTRFKTEIRVIPTPSNYVTNDCNQYTSQQCLTIKYNILNHLNRATIYEQTNHRL